MLVPQLLMLHYVSFLVKFKDNTFSPLLGFETVAHGNHNPVCVCVPYSTRKDATRRTLDMKMVACHLPRRACADQILSKVGDRLKLLTQCENAVGTFIAPS